MSVEPYVENGGTNTCVCLGAMRGHACDVEGLGNRADELRGQMDRLTSRTDGSRMQMDTPSMSNSTETDCMSHGDGAGTYLATGDVKHIIEVMDGVKSHADMLTGHGDTPSIETGMIKPANETKIISIPRKKVKPPDLPVVAATCTPEVLNGDGDLADGLTVHMDAYSIEMETEKAENKTAIIRTRQNSSQT